MSGVLKVTETDDVQYDMTRMQRIFAVVNEFPGDEHLSLEITTREGEVITLGLPSVSPAFRPHLQRLAMLRKRWETNLDA